MNPTMSHAIAKSGLYWGRGQMRKQACRNLKDWPKVSYLASMEGDASLHIHIHIAENQRHDHKLGGRVLGSSLHGYINVLLLNQESETVLPYWSKSRVGKFFL